MPIFPVNGILNAYRNKSNGTPITTLISKPVLDQSDDAHACTKERTDGWARCKVGGITDRVKYDDFLTADEYDPVMIADWPGIKKMYE